MNLIEAHAAIRDREDLVRFLAALREDLKSKPETWENTDLESFLEAMQSWVNAMEGYYKNHGRVMPNPPTWQMFADILMGARVYE